MATLSQYQIVGRYMSGTEVTAYHVAKVGEKSAARLDRDVVAYLAAKGQIVNCKGQLYKGKLILKGVGCRLDQLPSKQEAKKEVISATEKAALTSGTAITKGKDNKIAPNTIEGTLSDVNPFFKRKDIASKMRNESSYTVVASVCSMNYTLKDREAFQRIPVSHHLGYLVEGPAEELREFERLSSTPTTVCKIKGRAYWLVNPKDFESLMFSVSHAEISNMAFLVDGRIKVTNDIPVIYTSDWMDDSEAHIIAIQGNMPNEIMVKCVMRFLELRESGKAQRSLYKATVVKGDTDYSKLAKEPAPITKAKKPFMKVICRVSNGSGISESGKFSYGHLGWIVYDARKKDGKVIGYKHIDGSSTGYKRITQMADNNYFVNPDEIYGNSEINIEQLLTNWGYDTKNDKTLPMLKLNSSAIKHVLALMKSSK